MKPAIYFGGLDMRSPEEKLQDEIDEMAEYLDEQLSPEEKRKAEDEAYLAGDGAGPRTRMKRWANEK